MNPDHHRKTATIYNFPVRPRMAARNGAMEEAERFRNYVDCSSSYHQDAINEERSGSAATPKHS